MGDKYLPFTSEEVESDVAMKAMVNAFLAWNLPPDFSPDGGIVFDPSHSWPTGTNMLTYKQAEQLIRHLMSARRQCLEDFSG